MITDKYTKFILTLIAVGIIGLNFHLFKGDVIKNAYASPGDMNIVVTANEDGIFLLTADGKFGCETSDAKMESYKWRPTGC